MTARRGGWERALLLAAALAGACAAPPPAPVVPELLAGTMRQFNFRSEFESALVPLRARDWPALVALARVQIERDAKRGEWWQIAGYGQLMAGELPFARDSLMRAARLLPEEAGIWSLLAEAQARGGDMAAALRTLERALQTDPVSTVAWVQLGDLHAQGGRERDALEAYERALEIDARDIFAWRSLGRLAARAGDKAALERAKKALTQLYPPFAAALDAPR
jgi:tetratricopeptide (TPR) repeat protein